MLFATFICKTETYLVTVFVYQSDKEIFCQNEHWKDVPIHEKAQTHVESSVCALLISLLIKLERKRICYLT